MSGDPDTIREITARAQAVVEQECDMGDDGGPCDDCLAQRALRDDSLWLLDRLAAVEAQRDELARALEAARQVARIYEGLRVDANDGTFSLWTEDDLVVALHGLSAALAAAGDAE